MAKGIAKMTMPEQVDRAADKWTPQAGPRDAHGRWVPVRRTSVSEEERRARLAREAALRRQAQDQRTRIGRRVRSVENQLRAELRRQGRTITTSTSPLAQLRKPWCGSKRSARK
jgi:hypothetical protein